MGPARLVVAAVVLLSLSACHGGPASNGTDQPYVAMGDSYVSGPGLPGQDVLAPQCVRSERNYPHLVAADLDDTELEDVSCGGATTESVRDGLSADRATPLDPQLDALTPSTRLVTVGIGANDEGLYLGLFVHCLVSTSASEATCRRFAEDQAPAVYPRTRERVEEILTTVKQRSPRARVLLVGYLRIVPDSGDCPELELTEANRARAMEVEVRLQEVMRAAARAADVPFVDVRASSHGHDACAGDAAWVNGTTAEQGDGAVLHPTRAGMRAVADLVLDAVRSDG